MVKTNSASIKSAQNSKTKHIVLLHTGGAPMKAQCKSLECDRYIVHVSINLSLLSLLHKALFPRESSVLKMY